MLMDGPGLRATGLSNLTPQAVLVPQKGGHRVSSLFQEAGKVRMARNSHRFLLLPVDLANEETHSETGETLSVVQSTVDAQSR